MARVLVTNDDGVHATGILALATALAEAGHEVTVVAPLDDMSGSGAALGPGHAHGLKVERIELVGLSDIAVYGLDGPPGMCVMAAHLGAFGERPDIVASGINVGCNTGRSILFSGTVGAALAAANFGLKGVAVSQSIGDPWTIVTGAAFGVAAVAWALERPTGTVLNVNVPNLAVQDVKGVRSGRLAPFGVVRTVFDGEVDGRLQLVLRQSDELDGDSDTDTDTVLVNSGYVSVNALVGPRASDHGDAVEVLGLLVSPPR